MNTPSLSAKQHTATNPPAGVPSRDEDLRWYRAMQCRFESLVAEKNTALFTTSAGDSLFETYLDALPVQDRQYHNCRTCQKFFENYGALAVTDEHGSLASAMWDEDDAPEYYKPAVKSIRLKIQRSVVTGVFYSANKVWGTAETGEWCHYSLVPPAHLVHKSLLVTPFQRMAEKLEDFKNVSRALHEYNENTLSNALVLLKSEELYRAEKVLGPVQWLYDLSQATTAHSNKRDVNHLIYRAIATAPPGYAHPRSSMAGTLLDDISAGMALDVVKARFADKMHPLQYQRATAAPTDGNIKRGEEIVEKLGIAGSLRRRYARPEDVAEFLWKPSPMEKETKGAEGVFGHLRATHRKEPQALVPEVRMTWEKFMRTIITDALEIDVYCPQHGNYVPLTTAEDPEAPPILQWDRAEQRNPVCWYVWHTGSRAAQWGLTGGEWAPLWGITKKPCHWHGNNLSHFSAGALFLIEGAQETRWDGGLGLFPETLRSELREIRSTVEAYSRNGVLGNTTGPHAAGLLMEQQNTVPLLLRVKTKLGATKYQIDRWD